MKSTLVAAAFLGGVAFATAANATPINDRQESSAG
jgi:hypothetical protein